jgi:release factor glutamine methyltransferase
MRTLGERLAHASELLAPVTETPRLDAEILLAFVLGISRAQLLARMRDALSAKGFDDLVQRRLAHEPIAYILGEWEFFSLDFEIHAPVLVPRPETEHLVEAALDFIGEEEARVLDLCTGSGCIAVTVAHSAPDAQIVATDLNADALALAERNAQRHGVADRLAFRHGNLYEALGDDDGPFDVICSNPPYVKMEEWNELPMPIRLYEDRHAVLSGETGLEHVETIIGEGRHHLRPGGLLALEIGMGQHEDVGALFERHGYEGVAYRKDLAAIDRIVTAKVPG